MKGFRRAGLEALLGLCVLGYATISFYLVEYLQHSYSRDITAERTHYLSQQLALVRSRIEAMLTSEVFLATGLTSYLTVMPHSSADEWRPLAEQIVANAPHIRNIAIAPNNVVQFIYPLAGNQQALGLDYLEHPQQLRTVNIARQTKKIFVAGPLTLVQGGMGVIARLPIFVNPPMNTEYWGICSVVLDWDALLADAGVHDFPQGIQLAMRGVDGTGELGAVFYGQATTFQQPMLTENVHLMSGTWQLALKADKDAFAASSWLKNQLIRICGYLVALVLLLSLLIMFKAYRNAQRYSFEDVLTKLSNRRRVKQVLLHLIRRKCRFAILNIDLNHFKQVNDGFGHIVGDALLHEVAQRLQGSSRSYDTVARIGGDEFLLVLPRVSRLNDLHIITQKIRHQVGDIPFEYQDIKLRISLSIGFAIYPDDGEDIEQLLHHADRAMYDDKHQS
ncbi:sensor domain-containing diguanylate cyclase [Shewanella sp. A3A]|nr:sensor domain-containing diguanylate cyclase [Shewanella ferrihydritica]